MSPGAVHVVDDESAVRAALGRLLRRAGYDVTEHDSAEAFLAGVGTTHAGCVVLDLRLPGVGGLEVQEELGRRGCLAGVVFLTGHGDLPTGVRAMKRGATDFLSKPVADIDLLAAVAAAVAVADAELRLRSERIELEVRAAALTAREREVWLEVVGGRLNKQIAGKLGISERTVKAHRASTMEKLRVGSVAELALAAQKLGLIPTRS